MADPASIDDRDLGTCNHLDDDDDDDDDIVDEFAEFFRCCVCLDFLYKPIVLGCGHISCFWCVHRAMSGSRHSRCPICRNPYSHFPSICQLLHFLLLKIDPVAYRRREAQVLEEENKSQCFSPQFDDNLTTKWTHTTNKPDVLSCSPSSSINVFSPRETFSETCLPEETNSCGTVQPLDCNSHCHGNITAIPENIYPENTDQKISSKENNLSESGPEKRLCKTIILADVLCISCKQMLFRPTVLNCGHACCESCITVQDKSLRCQACQSLHPSGFPKVCLDLDHFLEQQFPVDYAFRRITILEQACCQQGPPAYLADTEKQHAESLQWSMKDDFSWWHENGLRIHIRVGCDSCGMYPIIGKRYRCKDCVETMGFDLCEECYETQSKLPGRFNQRHTPDHKFELIRPSPLPNLVVRLVTEQSDDGSGGSVLSDDAPDDIETDLSI